MNDIEQECIILNSVWEIIDGMVNWSMFVKRDLNIPTGMMFETSVHAKLFNILLGDFLSQLTHFKKQPIPFGLKSAPTNANPSDLTFLFYIRKIINDPKLGKNVSALASCTEDFAKWLEEEIIATEVNLADINLVADIRVPRFRHIKICGDIAKHNRTRLATNVKHIRQLLKDSGHIVSEQDAYLAVPSFFEWFHTHIFSYQSSAIVEFLNNIRWEIYEYLVPEFRQSWYSKKSPMYGYKYPPNCSEPAAQAMYWELMNRVRSKPWIERFVVPDIMKIRY